MSIGFDKIVAPFTKEQVDTLQEYQNSDTHHPFTCDQYHGPSCRLVPTVKGWICQYCDYTQNWAYLFMTFQEENKK